MTLRECAIVEAYTGKVMCAGEKRDAFYKYVEEIMGRPLLTHEHAIYADEIKKRSKNDFIELCRTSIDEEDGMMTLGNLQEYADKVLDVAKSEVRKEKHMDWTPINQEPEESGSYLVTVTARDGDETYSMVIDAWYDAKKDCVFRQKGWTPLNEFYDMAEQIRPNITAWMPYPEPYKGETA